MKVYKIKTNEILIGGLEKNIPVVMSGAYEQVWKDHIEKGKVIVKEIKDANIPYNGQDLNDKSLLIFRYGGFGDILFTTPLVRYLKRKYPRAKINFACAKKYHMVWRGNKDIARFGVHKYPIKETLLDNFDYYLHFDGIIEGSKEAEKENAYDLFFEKAGIDSKSIDDMDKMPIYHPDSYSVESIRNKLRYRYGIEKPKESCIILLQAKASSAVRTVEPGVLIESAMKLVEYGAIILFIGGRGDVPIKWNLPNIYNVAGDFSMTDSVSLLKYSSLVITPDSSFVHFAAALGVPCVSIYGPFPSDLRTRYYNNNVSIEPPPDAKEKCWPCFDHGKFCKKADQRTFISPCLSRQYITSELIVKTCLMMLGIHSDGKNQNTIGVNSDTNKR
jgi:ADP-heptose:LPS heptosyltransferase